MAAALPAAIVYPRATDDFMAEVQIVGLGSDATWLFDIEIEGERFGPWTLRTAPALDAETTFRLAIGSCTKEDEQPVFAAIRDWAPDTFLFLGDTHYGDTHSLSTMRQNNRWAHSREERAELLNETSMLSTWDDHDYLGNNTGGDEADRDIALRAFTEAWANPPAGTDTAPGTYFQHSWGDIDLFVLDVRSYRGVDDDLLGDEQTAWLLDALEQSTATFKLLAGGSNFSPDGTGDAWGEYDDAWPDLVDALAERNIEGLVLLSGDIHRMELRWLDGDGLGYDLPEITSSPLANERNSCDDSEGETVACWDEGNGFVGIEIDTTQPDPSLSAVVMDEDGVEVARLDVLRSQLQR
jgi:alkaline phosphatase D